MSKVDFVLRVILVYPGINTKQLFSSYLLSLIILMIAAFFIHLLF